MFCNTLGISEQWITTALLKVGATGTVEQDRRGHHKVRPHKITKEVKNSVRNHIQQFPIMPSHYTRKKCNNMYLEEHLSISKMHRLYLQSMQQENKQQAATQRQYREILGCVCYRAESIVCTSKAFAIVLGQVFVAFGIAECCRSDKVEHSQCARSTVMVSREHCEPGMRNATVITCSSVHQRRN
ncbi:hypothetical protein ILUMI_24460 [Ignelater luminosus]|uniref:Uncharacterized protein n=1 Tax=Ignelater luminosus TaxID=2038154 RepID=A0A8K0FYQ7_IGNLU|nr:hypothetical protein ILUMI_24460 [Ignelater luminosus]